KLPREHFDIARAEHPECRPRIRDRLQMGRQTDFVHFATSRSRVEAVEAGEVESLTQHEYIRDDVAASARNAEREVVTPGARVRIRRGDAIEVAGKFQRAA